MEEKMQREKIKELLKILKIENIKDRNNWVSASCPFARFSKEHIDGYDSNPSFGVSIGEVSTFNCFTCGKRGKLALLPSMLSFLFKDDLIKARDFVSKYEGYKTTNEKLKTVLEAIPETVLDRFTKFGKGNLGCISAESIQLWNLRYDPFENMLIFPIYDVFNRLVGVRGRYLGDRKKAKYITYKFNTKGDAKACGVWYGMNFELVPNKKLFLVEGERDAILLKQVGIKNVWAAMGSPSESQCETIRNLDVDNLQIVLYTDNDSAGEQIRVYLYKRLKGHAPLFMIENHYGTKDGAEAVEKGLIYKVLKTITQCG